MQKNILESIGIDVTYILIALLIFIIILLIMIISNKNKLKRLEKKYERFMLGSDGETLEATILEKFDEIDDLKEQNEIKSKLINEIMENLQTTYQKIGLVKYDAFKEMGGNISFVLVLLNKENSGFMINSMHSRDGCYTYVKEIIKGQSYIELGKEEKEALEQAVTNNELIL